MYAYALPISNISVLIRNGNGSYGTEERQRYNGTSQRQNGTAKQQRQNGNGMVENRHNYLGSALGLGIWLGLVVR